jgi:hypothetical protein
MDEKRLTSWTEEEMRCPRCGQGKLVKRYKVINASEKPAMKKEILKNHIYYFECDNCDLAAPLTYPSVYLDSKKKLAFVLSPEMEEETKKLFEELGALKGYKKRYVDNINDLKEKIIIAEHRLDDRVIELVKIEYIRQMEKQMKDDTLMNILFDYSGPEMFLMVFFEKKGIGRIPLNHEFYRQVETQYASYLGTVKEKGFEKIDMEWAGNLIFKRS